MINKTPVEGGFFTPSYKIDTNIFVLDQPWKDSFQKYFEDGTVRGIRVAHRPNSYGIHLDYLSTLPLLRSIEVYNNNAKDLEPMYYHKQLEQVGLYCPFKKLDFSRFPKLTHADITWRKGAETILNCRNLEYFNTDKYPYEDISPLHNLQKLKTLMIQSRKLTRLEGIEKLQNLGKVGFSYCSLLSDLREIKKCKNLTTIVMLSCKKANDISPFGSLTQLTVLDMENCDHVVSVKHLVNNSNLEKLLLVNMSVQDGDLTPLLSLNNLKVLAVARKRHHSHTSSEILKSIRNA